jgi:hypothetical protein
MQEINTFKTLTKQYQNDRGKDCTLVIQYGMCQLGEQRPYFSITANLKEGIHVSSGCLHDEIARHAPELADLIRWHLADDRGQPLHYVANALYWLELHQQGKPSGVHGKDPLQVFKDHVLFGERAADEADLARVLAGGESPAAWLERRTWTLQESFRKAMARHGVAMIPRVPAHPA